MHKSVLLNEAIAGLNIKEDGIYIILKQNAFMYVQY